MLRNIFRRCEVRLKVIGRDFEDPSVDFWCIQVPYASKAPVIATMFSNDNIRINLQGIGWEGFDWIHGLSICTNARPCSCSYEPLGSKKCGQFIDWLSKF